MGYVDVSAVRHTLPDGRVLLRVGKVEIGQGIVTALTQTALGPVVGLSEANAEGNVPAVARLLFTKYVFAFELTSALLITAALGAMVLAHRERLTPRFGQRELAAQRMKEWSETGKPLVPLPAPGVYARHNAVDTPALLPDGTPAQSSISSRKGASCCGGTDSCRRSVQNTREHLAQEPGVCGAVLGGCSDRNLTGYGEAFNDLGLPSGWHPLGRVAVRDRLHQGLGEPVAGLGRWRRRLLQCATCRSHPAIG